MKHNPSPLTQEEKAKRFARRMARKQDAVGAAKHKNAIARGKAEKLRREALHEQIEDEGPKHFTLDEKALKNKRVKALLLRNLIDRSMQKRKEQTEVQIMYPIFKTVRDEEHS